MHSVQPSVMVETPRNTAPRASHKFAVRPAAWAKGFAMIVSLAASQAFAQTPSATASSAMAATASADGVYDLLIGTYTGSGKSEGIYVYRFDTKNGDAHAPGVGAGGEPVVSHREPRPPVRLRRQRIAGRQRTGLAARRHQRVSLRPAEWSTDVSRQGLVRWQRSLLSRAIARRTLPADRQLFGRREPGRQLRHVPAEVERRGRRPRC